MNIRTDFEKLTFSHSAKIHAPVMFLESLDNSLKLVIHMIHGLSYFVHEFKTRQVADLNFDFHTRVNQILPKTCRQDTESTLITAHINLPTFFYIKCTYALT